LFAFIFLFCACGGKDEGDGKGKNIDGNPKEIDTIEASNTNPNVGLMPTAKPENIATDNKEKYLLRYRFQKGDEYRWNVVQQLKIDTTIKGTNELVETFSDSVKVWTVLEVDKENIAKFEYKVEGVTMRKFQTGQDVSSYDSSTDKIIPDGFRSLEGTIGVPLAHFMIDAKGVIRRKIPLKIYSDENRENKIVIHLPDNPIAVGDSWSVDLPVIDVPIGSTTDKTKKVSAKQRFSLESVRTGMATIKFDTLVLTPLEPAMQSKILDHYAVGDLMLDIDVGRIVSQRITVDKTIVGFVERNDSIHHISRLTECSCGLRSCPVCGVKKK
jgi:hypothetical protein